MRIILRIRTNKRLNCVKLNIIIINTVRIGIQ